MAKKKIKKAVTKKPGWVGVLDLDFCEPGLVYNIYQCRKCILEFKEDHARTKRKKYMILPGNKKGGMHEVCNCKDPKPLLIKYKKCPCNEEYWGFFLRECMTCKICGSWEAPDDDDESDLLGYAMKYYRLGEFYRKTKEDLSDSDKWDCLNRDLCLEVTFEDGSRKGIACLDCPLYEKGWI